MPITYGLRVRNNGHPERGAWATLVRGARAATGMSGNELSRRLKVNRATIWRWESGIQRPDSPELVHAFASLFGLDLEDALEAAGLRPERGKEPPAEPPLPPMDEDLRYLVRKLADPDTDEATRAFIKRSLQMLAAVAEQGDPPRPNRRAG